MYGPVVVPLLIVLLRFWEDSKGTRKGVLSPGI